ncbi:MAG: PAS domain-containing protein [Pseudomonadota bacterium]
MPNQSKIDSYIDQTVEPEGRAEARTRSAVVCSAEPGNKVMYVSDAFEEHTGYTPGDAIGKNLSFLQGPDTEAEAVAQFQKLIKEEVAGLVRITNYRADGTKFLHECDMRPVRDKDERVTHFIAIQRPVD